MAQNKPENTARLAVERHIKHFVYCEKTNNPFASGTPDSYYSGNKGDLWIEYKMYPNRPTEAQYVWLISRCSEGRNVGVAWFKHRKVLYLPGQRLLHSVHKPFGAIEGMQVFQSYKEFAMYIADTVGTSDIDGTKALVISTIAARAAKAEDS